MILRYFLRKIILYHGFQKIKYCFWTQIHRLYVGDYPKNFIFFRVYLPEKTQNLKESGHSGTVGMNIFPEANARGFNRDSRIRKKHMKGIACLFKVIAVIGTADQGNTHALVLFKIGQTLQTADDIWGYFILLWVFFALLLVISPMLLVPEKQLLH